MMGGRIRGSRFKEISEDVDVTRYNTETEMRETVHSGVSMLISPASRVDQSQLGAVILKSNQYVCSVSPPLDIRSGDVIDRGTQQLTVSDDPETKANIQRVFATDLDNPIS